MSEGYPSFPKIPRLHKEIVITEKIDGTNGLISIERVPFGASLEYGPGFDAIEATGRFTVLDVLDESEVAGDGLPLCEFVVRAGSRNRWLTPEQDNYGFCAWVRDHADELVRLGPGRHYGEWWGKGIQRGYGLSERRFSLFNLKRWNADNTPECVSVAPLLQIAPGEMLNEYVYGALERLRIEGSVAAPGFMRPEGVVVYHPAADQAFKVFVEDDGRPKSAGSVEPPAVEPAPAKVQVIAGSFERAPARTWRQTPPVQAFGFGGLEVGL